MPANGKPNGRFTLPALTPVSFSLTEGTDIPPPPDSPVEEKAPPAPEVQPVQPAEDRTATASAPVNGNAISANGTYHGRGRTTTAVDQPPMSPASTGRPSSIRRFLSRKSMYSNYTNGTNHNGSVEDLSRIGRPESPSSFLSGPPKKKRNSSWFGRLGSSGRGKRTSVVYESAAPPQQQEKMGPPPPKLPELNQLKAKIADDDEGSLGGGEMFKDIRGE